MKKIGILHPGEMGVSIAVSAINSGHEVYWTTDGRSEKTHQRAEKNKLMGVERLAQLCQTCEIILSVCPPHAAEDVALSVVDAGFKGLYLDANAIAPNRSIRIGQQMEAAGIRFVDGGIIGGPAWKAGETWLYLSGDHSEAIASCFSNGRLEVKIIGHEIGKASALKMCFAAYSKGTTALLTMILAASEALGVRETLYEQWNMDDPDFSEQVNRRATRVTAKAWRFEGEMHEIASTFREANLPDGFHEAAAEIYRRLADFKESSHSPTMDQVLEVLLRGQNRP